MDLDVRVGCHHFPAWRSFEDLNFRKSNRTAYTTSQPLAVDAYCILFMIGIIIHIKGTHREDLSAWAGRALFKV